MLSVTDFRISWMADIEERDAIYNLYLELPDKVRLFDKFGDWRFSSLGGWQDFWDEETANKRGYYDDITFWDANLLATIIRSNGKIYISFYLRYFLYGHDEYGDFEKEVYAAAQIKKAKNPYEFYWKANFNSLSRYENISVPWHIRKFIYNDFDSFTYQVSELSKLLMQKEICEDAAIQEQIEKQINFMQTMYPEAS